MADSRQRVPSWCTAPQGGSLAMAGNRRFPKLEIVTLLDEMSTFCFPEKKLGASFPPLKPSVVSQSREDPSWEQSAQSVSVPTIFFVRRTKKCRNKEN